MNYSFVIRIAKDWDFLSRFLIWGKEALRHKRKSVGEGVEAAARTLRYEALFAACRNHGCTYLATAHNADDQMETLLMRLFQAASVSSLKGIAAWSESAGNPVLISHC